MKFKYTSKIILLTLFWSCRNDSDMLDNNLYSEVFNHKTIRNSGVINLKGEKMDIPSEISPVKISFFRGFLWLEDRNHPEKLISIFDPIKNQLDTAVIKKGEGPGEMQVIANMIPTENSMFVFDIILQKIILFRINDLNQLELTREISLKTGNLDVPILLGNQVISTFYDSQGTDRFGIFNLTTNETEHVGIFPSHYKSQDHLGGKGLNDQYLCTMIPNQTQNRFAVLYKFQDLVEIYDQEVKQLHSSFGPDQFYPEFTVVVEDKNSYQFAPMIDKARYAYWEVEATQDEILGLYSGKYVQKKGMPMADNSCEWILVFSWDGEFKKAFRLDPPITSFAIDHENKIIYSTSTVLDNAMYKFYY